MRNILLILEARIELLPPLWVQNKMWKSDILINLIFYPMNGKVYIMLIIIFLFF